MTDFFSRLALRAVGRADRVQPIAASMFAPRRDQTSQEQSLESDPTGVANEPSAIKKRRIPTARPEESASDGRALAELHDDLSSRTFTPEDTLDRAEAIASPPEATRLVHPSRAESSSERDALWSMDTGRAYSDRGKARMRIDSTDDASRQIETSDPSAIPAVDTVAIKPNPSGSDRASERGLSSEDSMRGSLVASPSTRRQAEIPSIQASKTAEDLLSPSSVARSPTGDAPPPRSRELTARLSDGQAQFEQPVVSPVTTSQSAPSEPTIQVTIGRIEVRAASLAPTPRAKRPQASVSLADYLKERDRSGR
ncbi:MAG TPA: hypothetical protein VMW65_17010 [Chloroflexota bacterium]|nr:hypothetical protein [Chloroflexota bacterium]